MDYVLTFKNTNFSVRAEQCLLARGLTVGVLPLPSQISAGCGICLRIGGGDLEAALAALAEKSIDEVGLFTRSEESGRPVYARMDEATATQ